MKNILYIAGCSRLSIVFISPVGVQYTQM